MSDSLSIYSIANKSFQEMVNKTPPLEMEFSVSCPHCLARVTFQQERWTLVEQGTTPCIDPGDSVYYIKCSGTMIFGTYLEGLYPECNTRIMESPYDGSIEDTYTGAITEERWARDHGFMWIKYHAHDPGLYETENGFVLQRNVYDEFEECASPITFWQDNPQLCFMDKEEFLRRKRIYGGFDKHYEEFDMEPGIWKVTFHDSTLGERLYGRYVTFEKHDGPIPQDDKPKLWEIPLTELYERYKKDPKNNAHLLLELKTRRPVSGGPSLYQLINL
jgi:hypothetical protein